MIWALVIIGALALLWMAFELGRFVGMRQCLKAMIGAAKGPAARAFTDPRRKPL